MRRARILQNGARYHVTTRANRKEMIFDSDDMKDLFLEIVKRAKKKFNFQVDNFCIMGNHIHLIIKPGDGESLSRIMQWIKGVFAMAFNRKTGLCGHVWGGRFFSKIISSFKEYLRTFLYIDENPVTAQIVAKASDWRYGGLWHHKTGCTDIIDKPPLYIKLLYPDQVTTRL